MTPPRRISLAVRSVAFGTVALGSLLGMSGPAGGTSPPVTAVPVPDLMTSLAGAHPRGLPFRFIERDGGYSATTTSDGTVWVFDDTFVDDAGSQYEGDPLNPLDCRSGSGTAGTQTSPPGRVPARITEAVGSPTSAASCGAGAGQPFDGRDQPYAFLQTYTIASQDLTCYNWTNGLANPPDTNTVITSYTSQCFPPPALQEAPAPTRNLGTYVTTFTPPPVGRPVTAPTIARTSPTLPAPYCPGYVPSGPVSSYGNPVVYHGYLYLYTTYGGVPRAGQPADCRQMGLARAPLAGSQFRRGADYRYWDGSGWSPHLADAASILGSDYGGVFNLEVDVAELPSGEFVMTYIPPPPAPGQGAWSNALVRTSRTPYGPWSMPVPFDLPDSKPFDQYLITLDPGLDHAGALVFSYSDARATTYYQGIDDARDYADADDDGVRVHSGVGIEFAEIPRAALPPPP